jgi:hypothetical protein
MSTQYPGGFITKSPVAPTSSAASGIWTVDQAMQYQKAGTWPFGGPFNYIEDVFSTYLYTGTGATQSIVNNIDLSTYGGLVVAKSRSNATSSFGWLDTVRGPNYTLRSNNTNQSVSFANSLTSFNTNGFSLGADGAGGFVNASGEPFVTWSFRKQTKFFDVLTYTGDGTDNRSIAHNLGSAPGLIIVKNTTSPQSWICYHQSLGTGNYIVLNSTGASTTNANAFPTVSSSAFVPTANESAFSLNTSGKTFVVYLYAHNAGGFGLTGTDNVITCGSFTTSGTGTPNATVTLGYEPQWILVKISSGTGNWTQFDNMRGLLAPNGLGSAYGRALYPNLANAEANNAFVNITSTGFVADTGNTGETWIYIAIRKGPMKVPTDATTVFSNNLETTSASPQTLTTGFPVDLNISTVKSLGANRFVVDRLRGTSTTSSQFLLTDSTGVEAASSGGGLGFDNNTGIVDSAYWNTSGAIFWNFRRAPGFFDEVCYTGTGTSSQTITHNLGVIPELTINKSRSGTRGWTVYYNNTTFLRLNQTTAGAAESLLSPTSTTFAATLAAGFGMNASAETYVTYLFATLAGVSKVGTYSGTGATQTINCGFSGGARWVMVKRTDSTGDWYVWDTARGMVSGTDPSLLLNSTAAEVNANSVYTITTGFQIVSTAAGINASGGTYIFLAIA